MEFIKKILTKFFVMMGILSFIIIVSAIIVAKSLLSLEKETKENTALIINTSSITGDVSLESGLFDSFFKNKISLVDTLTSIRKAASDPKITAIFADVSEVKLSYAQVEELRNELNLFKNSNKPIYAWSDTIGEISNGTKIYHLASVFDKIYIQPSGMLGLNGLISGSMFFKKMFQKLKIEPIGYKREEYKTYWNMFSEEKYTDAHKESAKSLIDSMFSKIIEDISNSREISVEKIMEVSNLFSISADKAVEYRFIDGIKYRDEAAEELKNEAQYKETLSLCSYHKTNSSNFVGAALPKPQIAVIELPGSIHRGTSDVGVSGNLESSGSVTIVSLLKKAYKNEKVKGILIRVNSPGGSVVASESIWKQIETMVKEDKKPVVVSMGTVAASGGYYVSMPAEKIFASHTTVTGSIGVVIGKLYTKEFFETLGITFDSVKTGKNTDLFSSLTKVDEEQEEYIETMLDEIYSSFVTRAAENRKMEYGELEKHAKGRVWSGFQAKERGLVDEIGGFMDALEYVKTKSGAEDAVTVKYPESGKLWEILTDSEESSLGTTKYFAKFFSYLDVFFRGIEKVHREMKIEQEESFQLKNSVEVN
ncbi:MAG: signal peptide peptidase SppA [bacterium]